MPKLVWYCRDCGMVLKLWVVKCPNCRRSGISVLQLAVLAAVALPTLFLLLRFL